ncbi:MAG: threonine aldolase, partial [Clostridium sp.]|nr:threonine aldolase [Clostridium sp.]
SFKDKNINTKNLVKYFLENNIKVNDVENGLMRFVTHYWITKDDIYKIIEVFKSFLYTA